MIPTRHQCLDHGPPRLGESTPSTFHSGQDVVKGRACHGGDATRLRFLAWGVDGVVYEVHGGALVVAIVAIVAITGLMAAPAHGRLLERFDAAEHKQLMRADLVRTVLWTARSGVALAIALLAI